MADSSIHGALVDEASGAPAAGLRVEAWDTANLFPEAVAMAKSEPGGGFALAVPAAVLKRLAARDASIFFRVLRGEQVVTDTRGKVEWHPNDPIRVVVPVRLGDDIATSGFVVQGRVVTDRGSVATGLRVIAYDKHLKGETELGQTDTGPGGEYVIAYDRDQLGRKLFADLEVRAFRVAGNRRLHLLAASKVAYQAPARHVIDLQVAYSDLSRGSERNRLLGALAPLLEDVPLADVDAAGVTCLANRAG